MFPEFSDKAKNFRVGVYEHYKGNQYRALQVVCHHENFEEWVVYLALYDDGRCFIRPLQEFLEDVEVNGVKRARFQYIGE